MKGRVAFITGAASGIDKTTALILAAEGYGIAVLDLNESAGLETARAIIDQGGDAIAVQLDVADRISVNAAMKTAIAHFGRVDVLVSGAGFVQPTPILDITDEAWDRMIDVHLKGTFHMTQAVLPLMIEKRYGRIACISSMAAINGSLNNAHYAAAKAGIVGFVRAAARDVGPYGITINCVLPGAIDTPMAGAISPEVWARLSDTPVGRIGRPEDVAYAIRYLTSEEAEFINGTALQITGGDGLFGGMRQP